MELPKLVPINGKKTVQTTFGGYNNNLVISGSEFTEMKNMTGDYYPVISPRKKRHIKESNNTEQFNGVIAHGDDVYLFLNTNLYKNGKPTGVTFQNNRKYLYICGANIIVYPDKEVYNTTTGEKRQMNVSEYIQSGSYLSLAVITTNADGTKKTSIPAFQWSEYGAVTIKPSDPSDGDCWVDTTGDTVVVKKFYASSGMWLEMDLCTTLSIPTKYGYNIPNVLKAGDYITIAINEPKTELSASIAVNKLTQGSIEIMYIEERGSYFDITLNVNCFEYIWNNLNPSQTGFMYADFPGGTYAIEKKLPDMDFITICNNRLWGCSNDKHEIYASKLGDPTSFNVYMGIASDSYAVTVGSPGNFTGACTFNGYPYFFKENLIICVYGSKPSNYQISEIEYPGVEAGSERSLISLNSYLYYKGRKGIYRFNGGSAQMISEVLGEVHYKNVKAMDCADKLYFSLQDESNNNHLFVYDTSKGIWHREDDFRPDTDFFKVDNNLYGVNQKNGIFRYVCLNYSGVTTEYMKSNKIEDDVEWYVETGDLNIDTLEKKYITNIMIRISCERGSSFSVLFEYDANGKWERVYTYSAQTKTMARTIPIIPKRCDHMRMRIEGTGDVKIYSIQKTVMEGSEI